MNLKDLERKLKKLNLKKSLSKSFWNSKGKEISKNIKVDMIKGQGTNESGNPESYKPLKPLTIA